MQTRRSLFISMIVVALGGMKALFAEPQFDESGRPVLTLPDPIRSGKPDEVYELRKGAMKAHLKESQKKLRSDADHLLQLAQELKDEAYKTEHVDVLSVSFIRKTEEIEKLARQIKAFARSN
jgi:hypothetical protein